MVERFAKALSKLLRRFVESGRNSVDLFELWIESSIPMDLMEELVRKGEVDFPEELQQISVKGRVIWRRERE